MYLLDINVLLAFRYTAHVHHQRAERWIRCVESLDAEDKPFATCSIVDLGFIRIASGKSGLAENLALARSDLRIATEELRLKFLPDELDGNQLPGWVIRSKQTTDGHLLELATRHKMQFATLDGRIPGAALIPEHIDPSSVVREPTPVYDPAAWWGKSTEAYSHRV
jgi:predicted nucleic acid-binding protein